VNVSNYVSETSNLLGNTILDTSNIISSRISVLDVNVSNYVSEASNLLGNTIQDTSNIISSRISVLDVNVSNYVSEASNLLGNTILDSSNIISTYISVLDVNVSNYVSNTSNVISDRITNTSYWSNSANGIYYNLQNVGIGTDATNSYKLYVNGNTYISGDLSVTNNITAFVSDERLKTKVGKIENALDIINSLNAFKYKLNDIAGNYGFNTCNIHIGLSAQEVQKVLPEIVASAPFDNINNEYLTIQYERIIPVLVEAIKELSKKNDELTNTINKLIN
jgi:hypothetical protein